MTGKCIFIQQAETTTKHSNFSIRCDVKLSALLPIPFKQVCKSTQDRKYADTMLETYVTETVMNIITTFFSSPFADQSTAVQVRIDDHNLKV